MVSSGAFSLAKTTRKEREVLISRYIGQQYNTLGGVNKKMEECVDWGEGGRGGEM